MLAVTIARCVQTAISVTWNTIKTMCLAGPVFEVPPLYWATGVQGWNGLRFLGSGWWNRPHLPRHTYRSTSIAQTPVAYRRLEVSEKSEALLGNKRYDENNKMPAEQIPPGFGKYQFTYLMLGRWNKGQIISYFYCTRGTIDLNPLFAFQSKVVNIRTITVTMKTIHSCSHGVLTS